MHKHNNPSIFGVYNIFLEAKRNNRTDIANSATTISRYEYNGTLLKDYEVFTKSSLHFNKITEAFYNSFINYCILEKKHSANTLRRNVGLLKIFLNWAFDNGHTFKSDFKKFKSPKAQITDEVALTFEQVKEIYEFNFKRN
ncbi:MAG: phage integrase SAM-like domain-containing protein [Flavobacteriales bacterium]|nr:phage integrase SAM-like domain-containing protein [Flavobacteriales bacterium]